MSSIVLTGGGTAGHVIPNLALIPYLSQSFNNVCYIGRNEGIERNLTEGVCEYYGINAVKLNRKLCLENFAIPLKLIQSVKSCKKILSKIKPDVIFSKGGYVSLPVCLAGKSLKIPVVLHESDFSMGLSNKIASKFCDKILTSFYETSLNNKKTIYTGAPIREGLFFADKRFALNKFGFSGNKKVILVFGGSQGSQNINDALYKILDRLLEKYAVLHICGNTNTYAYNTDKEYFCAPFINDMASCYKACDIAISRGGANSIFELITLKIPSLIIPLSKNTRGDQIENANYFKKKGFVLTLNEKDLSGETLYNEIENLFACEKTIKSKIQNTRKICGNTEIYNVLISYAK